MKKILAFILTALLISASAAYAGKGFPMTLAGLTLGQDMSNYDECCERQPASVMPDAPFLKEAHLKKNVIQGIRGGSLTYANCNEKGKLVRIKLKFHDRSQKLFDQLLRKYEAAFGKADSYQGDSFRNIIAWEWDFTQGDERVSLILMWSRVNDMRPGVSIKMTLSSLLDSEYECYKASRKKQSNGKSSKIADLDDFLPR